MASPKVVTVVGSVNADVIVEVNRFPQPGETISARKNDTGYVLPGGKGANQAVAAKRIGGSAVKVNFIGVFGNDGNAQMLQKTLRAENVDISQSLTVEAPNGQALIFLDSEGENSIILIGGSNLMWPEGRISDQIAAVIKSSDVVLLQREIPDRINVEVARIAKKAGAHIVSDVGGADTTFPPELLATATFVCPNETELERIANGMPTTNDAEIKAAVHSLQQKGAQNILVTLGADGSLLNLKNGRSYRLPSIAPPGPIVDTTGAGDVFRAAFGVGLALDLPVEESLRRAAAASSCCITKLGATPSMPTAADVDALLHSVKAKL